MLTTCPDCNQKISESATDCPGCGRPMKRAKVQRVRRVGGVWEAAGTVGILTGLTMTISDVAGSGDGTFAALGMLAVVVGLVVFLVGRFM